MSISSLSVRLLNRLLIASGLTLTLLFFLGTTPAYAASPVIRFGHYDSEHTCGPGKKGAVTFIHGQYDIDSWTRDALVGEAYPFWSHEGLRANAVIARSDAWYFYNNKETGIDCIVVSDYDFTTKQIQGWSPATSADAGNKESFGNNRVTETMLEVMVDNQNQPVFFHWWDVEQIALENAGGTYLQRINAVYPGYQLRRIDQLNPSFSLDPRFRSMTNNTAPAAYPGWGYPGIPSDEVTPVNTPREVEYRWGLKHIDTLFSNPFGQPGTYMLGKHAGDLVEVTVYFGEPYRYLHLIGISDRPSPVYVNIYIDGLYRGNIPWAWNDNQRHLIIKEIPGIPYGPHAIAIQFRNDYWGSGGGEDGDRDLFLDVIGVSN